MDERSAAGVLGSAIPGGHTNGNEQTLFVRDLCSLHNYADEYCQNGFVIVENLFSADEIERLRDRTRDIAQGDVFYPQNDIELEPGSAVGSPDLASVRKLNRCAENNPVFLAHARHERVLDIVTSLIGDDIKLFASQCFMKPPGGIEKPYHQDSAYFTIEPMELVTCWTALDDVTVDNGALWVVRGSHREGLVDHDQEWMIGSRRDMQVRDEHIDRSRETPLTMPAGSCSFHHSLLLHRSTRNQSDRSRRGFAVHYMRASSRWTHPTDPQPDYALLRGREYPGCV